MGPLGSQTKCTFLWRCCHGAELPAAFPGRCEMPPALAGTTSRCCLPLLPPTAMPRCAAAGACRGAEFGAGLARVGRLEDLALGAGAHFVEARLARARCSAAGAVW